MRRGAMARWVVAVAVLAAVAAAPAAGAPEQTPKRGGTVVFGPVGESGCFNPFRDCGGGGPQFFWMLQKVLPPAFALAPDFTSRPTLVSKVTFTRTPPFTLTYTIRPEARWSDGVPVTARDFLFTHRAIREYRPDDVHRTYVRSVRAVDAKTVRVVLRSRYAGWRRLFWLVLPQHALAGEDLARIWTDGIENPKTGRPIGSGPFLVGDWERGKQLTLVRNPNYWGPHKAYLDRLIVRFCQASCLAPLPAEVLESMRTGAVDFTYARDTEIVPDLRRIRGTTVRLHRTNGWEHLDFRLGSGGHPALRSKLVRQALAYSIDRAEIVRQLWGEIDPTYRPLHSAVLFRNDRRYAAELGRLRLPAGARAPPARARRLPPRCRRHLRVRGRAPLVPLLHVAHEGASAWSRAHAASAPQGRDRGRALVRTRALRPDIRGRLRRRVIRMDRRRRLRRQGHLRLRWEPKLHRLLPEAGHGRPRPGRQDPRRRPARPRPQPGGPTAGQGRPRDSALPDSLGARVPGHATETSLPRPTNLFWNAENWWLDR